LVVRNTQKAYLNCAHTRLLSNLSLFILNNSLYFFHSKQIHIDIEAATHKTQANAKNHTLKDANIQNNTAKINVEHEFANQINPELNVS